MKTIKTRAYTRTTPLDPAHNVFIAAADSAAALRAAEQIAQALRGKCQVHIQNNPDPRLLSEATGVVITIGNLSDNRCVKALYYQHILFTDLTYPGKGGYELRTLLDPYATGHNVLHIGCSDASGLARAAERFIEQIASSGVGYLCEIHATQLPYDPMQADFILSRTIDLNDATAYYTAPIDQHAFIAYFTGNERARQIYNAAWTVFLRQDNNEDLHLRLKTRVSAWRLMELTGMLNDELYGPSINLFYRWVESREGLARIDHPMYQSPGYPRQNHGLLPALGIAYLADYLIKYGLERERAPVFRDLADRVFAVYCDGSWKPICDGLCHGWSMSQPVMLEYALFTEGHAYFASGGARQAAECLLAVTNNTGWMPESGDSSLARAFNGTLLACAAEYYRDGRYLFAKNRAPFWRQGNNDWTSYLPRSFDVGLTPLLPEDHIGVKVIPMDKLVYHAWDYLPELAAGHGGASTCPPAVPLEQCFDKLAYRAGFDKDDEYLLIDGLGGGSHSYEDAMSIVDYQKYGVDFVVACDNLRMNETENHSMLTIYRDGECEKIPSFPALQTVRQRPDGSWYISMVLHGCAGADWQRELFIVPDGCIVLQDSVTAKEKGHYVITSRLRTPGRATLEGSTLRSKRLTDGGETVHFAVAAQASDPCEYDVREIDIEPRRRSNDAKVDERFARLQLGNLFEEKYHLPEDEPYLTAYAQSICRRMMPEETVRFTNVLHASKAWADVKVFFEDGHVCASINGTMYRTPFAAYPLPLPTPAAQGQALPCHVRGRFSADITAAKRLSEAETAYGLADGNLFLWSAGALEPLARVDGPVNDILLHEEHYYVGYGDDGLAKLDSSGKAVWTHTVKRAPTIYDWWELPTPAVLTLKLVRYKGRAALAAGCGDDSIKFFGFDGSLLHSHYFRIGVPDLLETMDVNGDGVEEIIAGGKILNCRSNVHILSEQAYELYDLAQEGWTSHGTVLKCLEVDGCPALAVGVNHRNNLKLFQFQDAQAREIVNRPVIGSVTDIVYLPACRLLVAGTSERLLVAYGLDGMQRWMDFVDGRVVQILMRKNQLLVFTGKGSLYTYTHAGSLLTHETMGQPLEQVLEDADINLITRGCVLSLKR